MYADGLIIEDYGLYLADEHADVYTSRDTFRDETARFRCRALVDPFDAERPDFHFDPDRETPQDVVVTENDGNTQFTEDMDQNYWFARTDAALYWESRALIDDDPSELTGAARFDEDTIDSEDSFDEAESEDESESESSSDDDSPLSKGYSRYEFPPGRPTHSTATSGGRLFGSEESTLIDEEEESDEPSVDLDLDGSFSVDLDSGELDSGELDSASGDSEDSTSDDSGELDSASYYDSEDESSRAQFPCTYGMLL